MPSFTCPICGRRVTYEKREEARYRPFCSARCQWRDLGRWFGEEYRISTPVSEVEEEDLPTAETSSETSESSQAD